MSGCSPGMGGEEARGGGGRVGTYHVSRQFLLNKPGSKADFTVGNIYFLLPIFPSSGSLHVGP